MTLQLAKFTGNETRFSRILLRREFSTNTQTVTLHDVPPPGNPEGVNSTPAVKAEWQIGQQALKEEVARPSSHSSPPGPSGHDT